MPENANEYSKFRTLANKVIRQLKWVMEKKAVSKEGFSAYTNIITDNNGNIF